MDDINKFGKFGVAAMVPGMQHMLDLMQSQLDEYRRALQEEQKPDKKKPVVKLAGMTTGPRSYWYKMSPEERSKEMARRMKVRDKNKAKREATDGKAVKSNVPGAKNLRGAEA